MNFAHAAAERNTNTVMVESRFIRPVFFVVVFIIASASALCAQSLHTIEEEPSITRMLQVYTNKFKAIENVRAWRIQVAAVTDRREMEQEKSRFERLFPYLRLDWEHDNPYYILTIRDVAFQEKLDALHLLHKIKDRYPSAILVLDDVKPDQLSNPSDF